MDQPTPSVQPTPESTKETPNGSPARIKTFAVGKAGLSVLDLLAGGGFPLSDTVGIGTDPESIRSSRAAEKIQLETKVLRGLGSGGDPERGRMLAEEQIERLKSLCQGAELVFIIAGLGGGCGTGAGPVVARLAREAGALALAFVMTPFDCEGTRRQHLAQKGLGEFGQAADAVICLPNQKLIKTLEENTTVLEAYKLSNELLADAVRSFWRLATHKGLIDIHFVQLCELLRDQHTQSAFAVAEAFGPTRSRDVVEKLLRSPLLEGGAVLAEADSVLVSVMGGPDLTMTEVNRVIEEITGKCEGTQVSMGTAIHQDFADRLVVTLIAARSTTGTAAEPRNRNTDLPGQLLPSRTPRSGSRFVPPAPTLRPDQIQELAARQSRGHAPKRLPRLRQTQLPLEIVSKGRFDKSEPTIHKGEDLDVPTYIRRGVALN